ncbi:hypothetical protein ACFQV2_28380 [Actinokineospora soli]|uniref:Uncharacterized protein n=1 Tax=Actinokineospora soli TaxID=1048753 RepID=A0ABW2TWG2_9PSEU
MLAVVQHQQEAPLAQVLDDGVRGAAAGPVAQAEPVGDQVREEAPSRSSARAANTTPSGKARPVSRATRTASRVLPTPPGPVSVTRRADPRARRTSAASRTRPT